MPALIAKQAAAERDGSITHIALERRRIHLRRAHLHRVNDIDADLDEVGDEAPDRAAGMRRSWRRSA
jgi:hypothetical protein